MNEELTLHIHRQYFGCFAGQWLLLWIEHGKPFPASSETGSGGRNVKHTLLLFAAAAMFFATTVAPGFAQIPDPLGTATGTTITCPKGKITGHVCYRVAVTGCENTASVNAYF